MEKLRRSARARNPEMSARSFSSMAGTLAGASHCTSVSRSAMAIVRSVQSCARIRNVVSPTNPTSDSQAAARSCEREQIARRGEVGAEEEDRDQQAVDDPLDRHSADHGAHPDVALARHQIGAYELAQTDRQRQDRHEPDRRDREESAERQRGPQRPQQVLPAQRAEEMGDHHGAEIERHRRRRQRAQTRRGPRARPFRARRRRRRRRRPPARETPERRAAGSS